MKNAKPTRPYFRAALQTDGTLEILVYDDIGENFWDGGGVTAKSVKQQLDQAPNYSKILLRINSPGGDAFEGVAIYNVLRAQKKPVEVAIDGIAASAASIAAITRSACTRRVWPASVSCNRRPVRTNRRTPISSSRRRICSATEG